MDKSNFDIVRCDQYPSCPYWHIIITEGFQSIHQAQKEVERIIKGNSFYNVGSIQQKNLDMIKIHKDLCKTTDESRPETISTTQKKNLIIKGDQK